ncbi:MAG TPA: YdcF family protein, partial [Chitinophagaceae bacterium]|nr:YdcF family protein [Chitinophagaceae bacterium]
SYATFKKLWPYKKLLVTSPQMSFKNYPTSSIPLEKVINIMTGDLQRIKLYPGKGFQIYQDVPAVVWDAYEKLIGAGFSEHLIKE